MADTTAHGTPSGYSNGGCRCVECRQAMSDYRRARRVRSERYAPVRCSACRRLIEGCDGKWSDWMHSDTRSEFCADGSTLAGPERPDQIRFAPQRRLAS